MTTLYLQAHSIEMSALGNSKNSHAAEQYLQGNWTASGQHIASLVGDTSESRSGRERERSISPGLVRLDIPELIETSGIREVRSMHYDVTDVGAIFGLTQFEWQQAVITRGADGLLGFRFQKSKRDLDDPYIIVDIAPQVCRQCAHPFDRLHEPPHQRRPSPLTRN